MDAHMVILAGHGLDIWSEHGEEGGLPECRLRSTRDPALARMNRQIRLANLGTTVRSLERAIPHLLQQTMPVELVHQNIRFEVFPETQRLSVTGATKYKTLQKMIQIGVSPWLVPFGTKLSILNFRITKQREIEDRRVLVHWRTVLPEHTPPGQTPELVLEPGRLIASLGLLPEEYPVLAGSFEFGFDPHCRQILLHILRNVEYMSKPDSQLICT